MALRSDAIGIFWQDLPRKKGDRTARVMPPIPETGWVAPREFPNLAAAKALSIDVETWDPELKKHGPGWARGKGHIVGIAAGTEDDHRWYFPMRHEVKKDENLEPEHVLAWARANFSNPSQPKIGANIVYDVGWLREEGVHVAGHLLDVQYAEALLRESMTVNLEDLGERYLGIGKTSDQLYEWCAAYYGGSEKDQRHNLYRAPPSLVGPYAEGDVDLPFRVMEAQWPLLAEQGLLDLFSMECRLIYLMVEMRFAGVTIDLNVAEQLREHIITELEEIDARLRDLAGFDVNVSANESLARAFDAQGVPYGYTEKGNPSFTKTWLKALDHPLAELVLLKREREKLKGTFIESYLLESHVNGKVYGQFHQLRGDGLGARSGRFSSSNPNLQNIPIRSKLGKLIRTAFVPDAGHAWWEKVDYSQIEYRALAHYAVGPGADDIRARYHSDPNVDFHAMVQVLIREIAHQELDRSLVKNVNFGTVYGMGEHGLARYINLPIATAKALFGAIHGAAPFLRQTMEATIAEADYYGFITTILGRRSRFNLWIPGYYSKTPVTPVSFDRAILMYANPKRAYLHKALNRRLQGSAADLIKAAMLMCWEAGLFDEVGVPRLTVHDELDFSVPEDRPEVFREIYHTMETAIPFSVPVKVDVERGTSWGAVEEVERAV